MPYRAISTDSITMDSKQQMKNINTMVEYELWQEKFKNNYGVRFYRDEKYDLNRLNNTLLTLNG